MRLLLTAIWLGLPSALLAADPPTVRFDRVVIDPNLADAYQVEVADVDGDGKPDIIALGNNTIAWYQNPTWTKRVIGDTKSSPLVADIISSATVDLDGDGKAEVAIACDFAMNTPTRGQLFLASQGATNDDPWTFRKINDVPSIHRVRWADLEGDRKTELIVAPLFGPKSRPPTYEQDVARIVEFRPDPERPKTGDWTEIEIMRRPVAHAVAATPNHFPGPAGQQPVWISTANNTGISVAMTQKNPAGRVIGWELRPDSMIPGATGPAPKRGCSDFKAAGIAGHFPVSVTIEPWHGSDLVLWSFNPEPKVPHPGSPLELSQSNSTPVEPPLHLVRSVIDDTLDEGHALWTADVDGDGTDEIFAGHRGKDYRVAMYRFDGKVWQRTVLDTEIAAQDLRGGDLDGDGVPDIVAVGGKTHNVVWYRPVRIKGKDLSEAR